MRKLSPGAAGWVAVGAVVVAAELIDSRTMSEAFSEAARHPQWGIAVLAAWAILTGHLFGVLPPRYDPIHQFGKYTVLKVRGT